eukprot:5246535-Heterocapsa_arctica.AAC.1
MTQVTLLLETKLKLAEDSLMEKILILTARTSLLETKMLIIDKDEIVHMGVDPFTAAPTRKKTEGSRMAPSSQASAPSIVWMFGFPIEMMNKKLR